MVDAEINAATSCDVVDAEINAATSCDVVDAENTKPFFVKF